MVAVVIGVIRYGGDGSVRGANWVGNAVVVVIVIDKHGMRMRRMGGLALANGRGVEQR